MLVKTVDKRRLAVRVVKTALLGVGFHSRSVCVIADSWLDSYGERDQYAVFVSSPGNEEPFYVQGTSLVEAVRNMLDAIKGKANGTKTDNSAAAPF